MGRGRRRRDWPSPAHMEPLTAMGLTPANSCLTLGFCPCSPTAFTLPTTAAWAHSSTNGWTNQAHEGRDPAWPPGPPRSSLTQTPGSLPKPLLYSFSPQTVDGQVPSPSIGEQVPNPGCPASQPETSADRRPFPLPPAAPVLWTARPPCPGLHCRGGRLSRCCQEHGWL